MLYIAFWYNKKYLCSDNRLPGKNGNNKEKITFLSKSIKIALFFVVRYNNNNNRNNGGLVPRGGRESSFPAIRSRHTRLRDGRKGDQKVIYNIGTEIIMLTSNLHNSTLRGRTEKSLMLDESSDRALSF